MLLKRLFKGSGKTDVTATPVSFTSVLKEKARDTGPYSVWIDNHRWNQRKEAWCLKRSGEFSYKPTIGILMQSSNPREIFLQESLSSIFHQVYPFNELQIVDRGSGDSEIKSILLEVEKDPRVKVSFQKGDVRDTEAIAKIMKKAESEWLFLMGAEDVLEPNALYIMVAALQNTVDIDFVYADSDMLDEHGLRFDPQFKPVWAVGAHYPLGHYQHPILLHERLVKKLKGFEIVTKLMEEGTLLDEASNHSRYVVQAPGLLYHARLKGSKNEVPPPAVNNVLMNENYSIEQGKPVIDSQIRDRSEPNLPLNILWAVDSLELENGPTYLFYLARFLQKTTGHNLSVVSPADGPLGKLYEEFGKVTVTSNISKSIGELASPTKFDVAFVSSMEGNDFPEIPTELKIPSVWQICRPSIVQDDGKHFFEIPATIVFPNSSTARGFKKYDSRGVSRILPTGVEFPEIKLFRQRNSPFELRTQLGVAKSAAVISIFGPTIEGQKQNVFVESAVALLRAHPDQDIQFFIVGERPGSFSSMIRATINVSGFSERFHLIAETPNPADRYPYFWISDVCVSCSADEIFPLTILEAMAFKKAVVGTLTSAAHEAIEDSGNGFLVPPEDPAALTNALSELVSKMDLTEDFGRRSHEIAMDHYHIKKTAGKLEQYLRESIVY